MDYVVLGVLCSLCCCVGDSRECIDCGAHNVQDIGGLTKCVMEMGGWRRLEEFLSKNSKESGM